MTGLLFEFGGEDETLDVRNLSGGGLAGTLFIGLSSRAASLLFIPLILAVVLFSLAWFTVHSAPLELVFLIGENRDCKTLLETLDPSSVL